MVFSLLNARLWISPRLIAPLAIATLMTMGLQGLMTFADEKALTGDTEAQEPIEEPGVELNENNQPKAFQPVLLTATLVKSQSYPVDLKMVLDLVMEKNLSLSIDQAYAKIEKARLYGTLANFLPDVVGTLDQNRLEGNFQLFGNQVIPVERTQIQPQLEAILTVYPGGRHVFETLAQRQRHRMAKHQVEETLQTQMAMAAQEYYNLVEALDRQKIAVESITVAKEQVAFNEARREAGVGTKLEVMQAKTEVSRQEGELIRAESAVFIAEQALLNRLNLDPDIHLTPLDVVPSRKQLVPEELETDVLIQAALARHPQLDKIRSEVKALRSDRNAVVSDIIPSVRLNTYISGIGAEYGSLSKNEYAGFQIRMNLFEKLGLSIPLRTLEKNRLIETKRLELVKALRDLETRVVRTVLDVKTFEKAMEVAHEAHLTTEESYRLANGRFRAGVGIHLDVIEAEKNLMEARTEYSRAVLNYNRAQVQLLEVLGAVSPDRLLQGVDAQWVSSRAASLKEALSTAVPPTQPLPKP